MSKNAFKITILCEQLASCFLTNTGNSRNIVRFISNQTFEVWQLAGRQAVTVEDRFLIVFCCFADTSFCNQSMYMLVDELQRIHVTCEDDGINSLLGSLNGECSQHIISLEAIFFVDGNIESLDYLTDTAKLGSHDFGECRSMYLILGVIFVAEGRSRPIKSDSDIVGFDICKRFD